VEEAKTDPSIFVLRLSLWQSLPAEKLSDEKFYVEVGDEFKQTKIVESPEEADDPEDVISVPMDFKPDFERDIEGALRDLGGIAAGTRRPFIPYRELILKAQTDYMENTQGHTLFKYQEVVLDSLIDRTDPQWTDLVDVYYIDEVIPDVNQVFAIHLDMALSGDAGGLAIGRVAGYKLLPTAKYFSERLQEFVEVKDMRVPIYQLDGLLRILAPKNGEIDLALVRDLVLWLRSLLKIKWATLDSYQSAMLIQAFRRAKMRSGVLSVDTTIAPYTELKLSIKDERLWMMPHDVAGKELRELERDAQKDKVDHPPGGSKDVSDAAAGVVYMLQKKEANVGRGTRKRRGMQHAVAPEPGVRMVRMGKSGRRKLRSRLI
jgi:hypothetical protein